MAEKRKQMNELTGKEWLQYSFSIWRDIKKTSEEKKLGHPASYPVELCEKILKTFSLPGSKVLDPFNGIGSTMVAVENTKRYGVGIDLSKEFCEIARNRINDKDKIEIINGDSFKEIKKLSQEEFDMCVTSPPYWDILNMKRSADGKDINNYSNENKDIGNISNYDEFLETLKVLFTDVYRVMKHNTYCIINVMDIRKKSQFYPLHSDLAEVMKKIGYKYDDLIIWDRQGDYNNMKPLGYPSRFRINKVHEYLLIFIKE